MKRLEYAQQILDSGDAFHNVIFSDECSVSLEQYRRTCYRKVHEPFKRKPRPKHSLKVHVWEGISRKGATKVFIFDGIMDAELYWRILETTLLPFINQTLLDHRFEQDNDPNIRQDEGLLRGEWYKLVAYSPRESGFKSHRELRHELKFYLESKVKP